MSELDIDARCHIDVGASSDVSLAISLLWQTEGGQAWQGHSLNRSFKSPGVVQLLPSYSRPWARGELLPSWIPELRRHLEWRHKAIAHLKPTGNVSEKWVLVAVGPRKLALSVMAALFRAHGLVWSTALTFWAFLPPKQEPLGHSPPHRRHAHSKTRSPDCVH